MKKRLLIAAGLMVLVGFDGKSQVLKPLPSQDSPSIAEMMETGKKTTASECKKGEGTFNCEFLTDSLREPGKWHHTTLTLYKGGEAEMVIDGNCYNLDRVENHTSAKQETITFFMKRDNSNRGEIKTIHSDEGKVLSFIAYYDCDKPYTQGAVKLN